MIPYLSWIPSPVSVAVCRICGSDAVDTLFCKPCQKRIAALEITGHCCEQCGIPLISEEFLCSGCRIKSDHFPGSACYFYRGEVRTLIRRFKFEGQKQLAAFIAAAIARRFDGDRDTLVLPVPSSRSARRRNGWGHMEQVARILAQGGFRISTQLLKRHRTRQQKSLDTLQREENMRDAFYLSRIPIDTRILLIDDVHTTGATLQAACREVAAAGVESVSWIAFAID